MYKRKSNNNAHVYNDAHAYDDASAYTSHYANANANADANADAIDNYDFCVLDNLWKYMRNIRLFIARFRKIMLSFKHDSHPVYAFISSSLCFV